MKHIFITLCLSLTINSAFAKILKTKIDSLNKGSNGQPHLVLFDDGSVGFLDYKDKSLIKQIEQMADNKSWVEARLDSNASLVGLKILKEHSNYEWSTHLSPADEPYVPTIITRSQATSIFTKMSKNYQKVSQCYNRAHIWTHDEFVRSNTYLNKVFLFFTSSYIRKYRFHWWFHVTPMALVGGTTSSYWRMLDRRYTRGPLTSKTWTDIFIKSKRTCKIVNKYSDYRNNQRSQDCYMIPMSMYYLVPSDIERLEQTGEARTEYDESDVDFARWEAFKH